MKKILISLILGIAIGTLAACGGGINLQRTIEESGDLGGGKGDDPIVVEETPSLVTLAGTIEIPSGLAQTIAAAESPSALILDGSKEVGEAAPTIGGDKKPAKPSDEAEDGTSEETALAPGGTIVEVLDCTLPEMTTLCTSEIAGDDGTYSCEVEEELFAGVDCLYISATVDPEGSNETVEARVVLTDLLEAGEDGRIQVEVTPSHTLEALLMTQDPEDSGSCMKPKDNLKSFKKKGPGAMDLRDYSHMVKRVMARFDFIVEQEKKCSATGSGNTFATVIRAIKKAVNSTAGELSTCETITQGAKALAQLLQILEASGACGEGSNDEFCDSMIAVYLVQKMGARLDPVVKKEFNPEDPTQPKLISSLDLLGPSNPFNLNPEEVTDVMEAIGKRPEMMAALLEALNEDTTDTLATAFVSCVRRGHDGSMGNKPVDGFTVGNDVSPEKAAARQLLQQDCFDLLLGTAESLGLVDSGKLNPFFTKDGSCSSKPNKKADPTGTTGGGPPDKGKGSGAEALCSDKLDNDSDGAADCSDSDCSLNAACTAPAPVSKPPEVCTDLLDNDGDGRTDCSDSDCAADPSCKGGGGGGGGKKK